MEKIHFFDIPKFASLVYIYFTIIIRLFQKKIELKI
jgi:hypothetical protein